MAKFKPYNYDQMVIIPITLKEQLEPGTLEYSIDKLVQQESIPPSLTTAT